MALLRLIAQAGSAAQAAAREATTLATGAATLAAVPAVVGVGLLGETAGLTASTRPAP